MNIPHKLNENATVIASTEESDYVLTYKKSGSGEFGTIEYNRPADKSNATDVNAADAIKELRTYLDSIGE